MTARPDHLKNVAFVADYPPRRCGIATFTADLRRALVEEYPDIEAPVIPVTDAEEGYAYPPEVRLDFAEKDLRAYRQAADFINLNDVDVVSLQHEYGIFGGTCGSHVLTLVDRLEVPVVTTCHTVLAAPSLDQRRVLGDLAALSSRLVVMSEKGREMLCDIYGADPGRVTVVPHGIPDVPFVDPEQAKAAFGVQGRPVLLTFGLLSPNKGIEYSLDALPRIRRDFPDVVYIILGATHPALVRERGEDYRLSLERRAEDLGVQESVIFHDRFVELDELLRFLAAADLYITPYLNREQITSGTLAYAFGTGKGVISTPYWHAEELLAEDRGVLVPFRDPDAIAETVCGLLGDRRRLDAMRRRAYALGREMTWRSVARRYVDTFVAARRSYQVHPATPQLMRTLQQQGRSLPDLRLDHLQRLSDSTGLLQHARFTLPRLEEGYCTDDNARGLLFAVMLEGKEGAPGEVSRLAERYAAFIEYAFNRTKGRFRNFMSFDRRWLEEVGSDDSHARAFWALASCIARTRNEDLRLWATDLFEIAMEAVDGFHHHRACAFALLGLTEYLGCLPGDRLAVRLRDKLVSRLLEAYDASARDDWLWYEDLLSYDNARLPQALLAAARSGADCRAREVGLDSLEWLMRQQTGEGDHLVPIGSSGFYRRGGERARFDQQPVEAWATVSACLEAHRATAAPHWLDHAQIAFDWFLGRNDLGEALYDPTTGGCRDALHMDRTNRNQGAESTLSFLLALVEMRAARQEGTRVASEVVEAPA